MRLDGPMRSAQMLMSVILAFMIVIQMQFAPILMGLTHANVKEALMVMVELLVPKRECTSA